MAAPQGMMHRLGDTAHRVTGTALDDHLQKLRERIVSSGSEGETTPEKILGAQIVCSLIAPVFVVYVIRFFNLFPGIFQGPAQILLYLGLIAFGFYFPAMSLRDKMLKRQKKILLQLPDVIDLLTISVEAGLDFMGAMRRVVQKMPEGALREELERFFKQVELGKTRKDALKELSKRVQLTDLSTITSSLIQADQLGSSIGPILRVQSDMLRVRRGQRAEKAAMEAPVKMLMPLLMCIFPAVFIMLFAPLFIQMILDITRQ